MEVPRNCRYTKDHFWVRPEGNWAVLGVSHHLQEEFGDVIFVDLPEMEDEVEAMGATGVIESEKAVTDIVSPVSGEVTEINIELLDSPDLINEDPYGEGWLLKVRLDEPGQLDFLMTPEEYEGYIQGDEAEE